MFVGEMDYSIRDDWRSTTTALRSVMAMTFFLLQTIVDLAQTGHNGSGLLLLVTCPSVNEGWQMTFSLV